MPRRSDVPADAVETVARHLANRGDADDETFARDLIGAMLDDGWQPPRPVAKWSPKRHGAPPNAEYLAAKDAMIARGHRPESEAS